MPLYEYRCSDCQTSFEKLRPMSDADQPTDCPNCRGRANKRLISTFAAVSKSNGASRQIAGGQSSRGCGSCSGGSCASCGH